MPAPTKKAEPTAEEAYEIAHLQAQDLVERVRELLFELPAPGDGEAPVNWGHVGSLGHVNELLSEIVGFLNGQV